MTSDGEDVDTSLRIYGKGQGAPLIIMSEAGDTSSKGCVVSGGLEDGKAFKKMEAAFDAALQRTGTKDGDHYFRVGEAHLPDLPTPPSFFSKLFGKAND